MHNEDIYLQTYSFNELISYAFENHLKGNLEKAKIYYQLFIDKGYINNKLFNKYSVLCYQNGETNKAIELLNKSIDIYPNNPISYNNLGNMLRDLGKAKVGKEYLIKAIKLKYDFPEAHYNLSKISIDLGDK